jgi:hypothetical protein
VPDETQFDDREARDEASDIPDDYSPPDLNQHTLQHTKVRLQVEAMLRTLRLLAVLRLEREARSSQSRRIGEHASS